MGSSNRCTLRTIVVFYITFFLSYLPADSATAIPTAEDINSLANKARLSIDTFSQKSFQLRMSYEYSGVFLNQRDREHLHTLARNASDQLLALCDGQQKLAKQIEDYQGDDWDDRYGSTGLWRKLYTDLYTTNLSKCQVDLYIALSAKPPHKGEMLDKVLDELNSLKQMRNTAYLQFLKAKTYSLLARTDPIVEEFAEKEFDQLTLRSDMSHSTVFRIAIERIKLFGPIEPDQLKKLAQNIAKSRCKDDIELVLSLACVQRRYDSEALEETVQTWPQIEDFLGSLALSDLAHRIAKEQLTKQHLQQISIFEVELAAQTAWKNNTKEYKTLLGRLSGEKKFQMPLILYVAAIAFADSSPNKAVYFLIKASTLQQQKMSDRLNIEAREIAKQAAKLAYNLYTRNPDNCHITLEAFGNYHTMAAEEIDEKLEYLYTTILGDCGQDEKSKILLDKIASQPGGRWRNRAKLDLITTAIEQSQSENREKHSELLKQLGDLIKDCRRNENNSRLRTEAITVYCQLLLKSNDNTSAQKVLDIVTDVEIAIDPNLSAFKSDALRHLGKLEESAEYLAKICHTNNYEHVIEAEQLLLQIIDRFEQLQHGSADFAELLKNSLTIARYCERISLTTYGLIPVGQARLYLAEILIFSGSQDGHKLHQIEKLLNDFPSNDRNNNVDFVRCRARLFTSQGKFVEAAQLWAQIAKTRKNESHKTAQRTWKWWRAKFYELDCLAKMSQTEQKDILHTIEVLENSFTDIPSLWAENLNLLKQRCPHSKK